MPTPAPRRRPVPPGPDWRRALRYPGTHLQSRCCRTLRSVSPRSLVHPSIDDGKGSTLPAAKCPCCRAVHSFLDHASPAGSARRSATNSLIALPLALRSEEHTSELQSLMRISYAVFCLKKKKHKQRDHTN